MYRDDVVKRVRAKLKDIGVGKHLSNVRKVPSKVELVVYVRDALITVHFRSGITSVELEAKLAEFEALWQRRQPPQIDIEDAITTTPRRS